MRRRRSAWLIMSAAVLVAVFALVLAAAPLLHHDFACHLKSSSHCPGCTSGLHAVALAPQGPSVAGVQLAGFVPWQKAEGWQGQQTTLRTAGRAPPVLS